MIAVNSDDFYYLSYSNLSPYFSDKGTVETVMAGTVDNAETIQNSGWGWSWIVIGIAILSCLLGQEAFL